MKRFKDIRNIALMAVALSCGVTSCNYLDVVPPEQAELPDATKDAEATLGFLYSCYGGVNGTKPFNYEGFDMSTDEFVLPALWQTGSQTISYDLNPISGVADGWVWGNCYRFIGQCHLFLQELPNARGVTEAQKKDWALEANFLIAYYHMITLMCYGPCPINDHYIAMDTPTDQYPGRSHFDYVKEWVCKKFDEVAEELPQTRTGEEWGRATSVMAKALKARLLLYAASPLWNGDFPYKDWKNTNYETPGYGKELVSHEYSEQKWRDALDACQKALQAALDNGYKLLDLADAQALIKQQEVSLPFIPFKNNGGTSEAEEKEFKERVLLMRYVVTTRYGEGNRETIWGLANQGSMIMGSIPHRVIKTNNGDNWHSGYSGVSPTLNTVENFYTENGKLPKNDKSFYSEGEWFESAGVPDRSDIIKLNARREPRFYAWMAFDGGDMGSKLYNGAPLKLELRKSTSHGYDPDGFNRDNCVTGYLSQKYIEPTYTWSPSGVSKSESKPRPLLRLAELYLNLAECYAALGQDKEALEQLNVIRKRAGVPELSLSDIDGTMSAMDWVRSERTIELWGEGHRYYDLRRWMTAKENLGSGVRMGLNALQKKDPTFEEFNKPVVVDQNFKWTDRMYLLPLYVNEVYKNPQMIQSPGY